MVEITGKVFGGDVKNEDENLNVFEDVFSLRLEVLLHEHVLATAVPQRKHEVAEEADPLLIDIDCESDTVCVSGEIVGKDDRSHGGLACAHTSHKKHFLDFVGFRYRVVP